MTINGVEIGEFGGSLLTYKVSPANIQHAVTTGYNSAFPVLMDTEIGTKTLTLTMHIRGGALKLVTEKEALLLEALYKQSEIELPFRADRHAGCHTPFAVGHIAGCAGGVYSAMPKHDPDGMPIVGYSEHRRPILHSIRHYHCQFDCWSTRHHRRNG